MLPYTIDDSIETPLRTSVEVTIDLPSGKRWLAFVTPELLASVGDWVPDTQVPMHLGERHVIVVGTLTPAIIDAVLRQLYEAGELESRTLPLHPAP